MRSCYAAAPVCTSTPMIDPNEYTNRTGEVDLVRLSDGVSRFVLLEPCASGWDVDFPEASKRLRPFPCE
jgi:hypothetical protein